jgi:hypothetical protein
VKKIDEAISNYTAKIGRRGGSKKTDAKAEAARLNGRLGGRPSGRNAPRETFNLQIAIGRLKRAADARTHIAGLIACDRDHLTVPERVALRGIFKTIQRIEKRWGIMIEENESGAA